MMPADAYSPCINPCAGQLSIDSLSQIKVYCSQFWGIKHAVNAVKNHTLHEDSGLLCIHCKTLSILNKFNHQIIEYKKITDYHENITTLEQLDELEVRLITLEYDLQNLKKYHSKIALINKAIKRIPKHIEMDNASKIIKEFNDQIADCKSMAQYDENISNKKQLEKLEERLDELDDYSKSLERLWRALPTACKPLYKDPLLIKGWLQNPRNQHVLANVTSLRLNGYITILPVDLSKVPNLQELDLSVNRLTVFPEWISRYLTIRKLNLSCNDLKEFPITICQCSALESLNISNNKIEKLPKKILQLSNLTELNLRMNMITVIPHWIRRSKILKVLNLSYNELKELPIMMCQCPALEILDVSNNWIEELPLAFTIWKGIRELLIAQGRTNSRQLEIIDLTGNPVTYR